MKADSLTEYVMSEPQHNHRLYMAVGLHSSYEKFSKKQTQHNRSDCHETSCEEADGTRRIWRSTNRDVI